VPIKDRGLHGTNGIVRRVPGAQGVSLGLLLYPMNSVLWFTARWSVQVYRAADPKKIIKPVLTGQAYA
jgi:hypothetical protein